MRSSEKLKDLLLKELLLKDTLIKNTHGMKDKYYRLAQELNFKLKIPRHHLEFLHQKGTLDHFVSCKISGDDMESKWSLLNSGQKEIQDIHDHNLRELKATEKKARDDSKLKMYGLLTHRSDDKSPDGSSIFASSRPGKGTSSLDTSKPPNDRSIHMFVTENNELKRIPTQTQHSKRIFEVDFQDLLAGHIESGNDPMKTSLNKSSLVSGSKGPVVGGKSTS